jgi:hypothetical protein
MNIGSGINIGGGINIKTEVTAVTMRSLLSSASQTAYDSTTPGNWFNVTSTDYAAVYSGLASVTKYGLTDTQLGTGTQAWSANYAQAFGINMNGQLSAGTYVIGFVSKISSGTGGITPLISTTLPTTGTYSPIANTAYAPSSSYLYYLRRASTATAATSYIGIVGNVTMTTNQTITSGISNWYSSTSPNNFGPPWTVYGANPILFQALGTPTYQWT